jgi:uncharacterized SAM-binding protein YcdF (DUF218 family)
MFFIISKLLLFVLGPFNWLLAILIIAFFSKSAKLKKRLYITVILIYFIFGNHFIFNKLVNAWQTDPAQLHLSYAAGIVLGGFTSFDKNSEGFFNSSSDRFIETAKLYHQGTIKKIIASGGSGSLDQSRPKEASFVHDEFIKQGIPAADVFFEDKSRNTLENAQNCKKLLDSLNIQSPVVLITSATHMRRALLVFKTTGRDIIPYPANYDEINVKFSWDDYIIPDIEIIIHWQKFLKEIVGFLVYKITGKG